MATTARNRKTAKPADNETPENTTPETPEKETPEETTDPRQDAINAIPEEIEDGTFPYMLAERLATGMVDYARYSDIILRNTPNEEGIRHYAETSDAEDVVKHRTEVNNTKSTIAELQEKIESLRSDLGRQTDALNEAAREEMNRNLDTDAKVKAKADREKSSTAITSYLRTFKVEFPDWEDHENIKTWMMDINKTVNGAGRFVSQNSGIDPRNAAYNKRVREWAQNNGLKVSERGRIADSVYLEYVNATGDRKPQ